MNNRQIRLFDILFEQDDYITAKTLAEQLKVTPKTIYLDIRKIEESCSNLNLYIDRRPNHGLMLIGQQKEKQKFKNQIHSTEAQQENELSLESRRLDIFRETLLKGQSISLQDFSEQYFVSKTAILNDLEYFSQFMEQVDVQFVTINKRIEIIGTESDIQSAIVNYLFHLIYENKDQRDVILERHFGKIIYSVIKKIYTEGNMIDFSRMNDYYEESLFLNLLAFVTRIQNGKHLKNDGSIQLDGSEKESYPLAFDLCSLISQRLEITFENEDIEVLSKLLFAHKAFPIKVENQSWGETVDEIIRRLEQTEDIVLDDSFELRSQLLSHLPAMVLRLSKGVKITNPLLQEIKNRHLPLFTASWYILSILESKYHITLNDDEVAFITIFFQMAINKTIPSHNILVICPYGAASSQFIVRKLRQILPKNDVITSCRAAKLKEMDLNEINLIVTTTPMHLDEPTPMIQVSPFLNNEDYAKIFKAYAKYVFLEKNRLLESLRLHQLELPSLKKYIKGQDLFFRQTLENKEECLDFLISQFEKNGYVKEGFRKSVFEREKIGSTGLENNVALPHAKPELCNQVAIGILTLTHPIKWTKEYDVDMIVLLSVPSEMENEFGDIVLDLYHLIENSSIVAEIKKLKQGDDLISILNLDL